MVTWITRISLPSMQSAMYILRFTIFVEWWLHVVHKNLLSSWLFLCELVGDLWGFSLNKFLIDKPRSKYLTNWSAMKMLTPQPSSPPQHLPITSITNQPQSLTENTVCPKGQVKIYLLITRAIKHSKTLERWHF